MSRNNKSRQRFIEKTTIDRVMDFAADAEWRLLIVLARYGGLRVPSEPLSLRWCDVDWQRKRVLVTAPNTEHHEGKGTRWIPMFPELVDPLRNVYEQAEPGDEFVIVNNRPATLRDSAGNWQNANLRTQFARIIRRAGFEPWPKLWQNLRSTRETELTGPGHNHPLHVVTAWLGNTEAIAREHYLQITDGHFERATALSPAQTTAPVDKTVRKLVRSVQQTLGLWNLLLPGRHFRTRSSRRFSSWFAMVSASAEPLETRAGCGGGGGSAGCVVMKLGVISRLTVTETGGDFQSSTAFGGVW